MSEQILFYEVCDNGDLSHTLRNMQEVAMVISGWMDVYRNQEEIENAELHFTITPVYMTEGEFNNLEEA